ncbi:Protein fuzzy-like protein [Trichoplax sp. H2]|nr:Protein fuzzy-like protein [Trichoplax sp. H2]|eukprot:RDD46668.1 Protein fuzzy-like protein [Trichoplax sp. H2]
MAYVIALTSGGGVPLFTRTIGDYEALPFPTVGSLNGVHMFTETHGAKLLSTRTQNAKIVWQVFNDSITIIIVTVDDGASDVHLKTLLQFIYNAMILFLGENELKSLRNVERLKKELKSIYFLIDKLLEESLLIGHITGCLDTTAFTDIDVLQDCLEAFVGWCNTEFGCVLINGKLAASTTRWWNLPSTDSILLSLLISAMVHSASKDIAIYLPATFPDVPHRLMTFQILDGVEVCVLCGSTPSHNEVLQNQILDSYWRSCIDILKNDMRNAPKVLPPSITLDFGILGFILLNQNSRKCLATFVRAVSNFTGIDDSAAIVPGNSITAELQCRNTLVSFYKSVVDTLFPVVNKCYTTDMDENIIDEDNTPVETYMCSDEYKLHALHKKNYQCFIMFSKDVPVYALSQISSRTLEQLCQDGII